MHVAPNVHNRFHSVRMSAFAPKRTFNYLLIATVKGVIAMLAKVEK